MLDLPPPSAMLGTTPSNRMQGLSQAPQVSSNCYLASRALITNMKEVEGEGGLESTSKSQPSVLMIARNASQEKKFMHVNNAIIDLICVSGVPPEFFSGQPWKNFMAVTDPMTHTSSASTFAHTFIPAEATHITEEVFQKLRKQINLTISFDGGTTHAIQSIYTTCHHC